MGEVAQVTDKLTRNLLQTVVKLELVKQEWYKN